MLDSTVQTDFASVSDGDSLTCILPPDGDYWPFGGNPNPAPGEPGAPGQPGPSPSATPGASQASGSGGLSGGAKAGVAIAVIFGVLGLALITWLIRRAAIKRLEAQRFQRASTVGYSQNMGQVVS